MGRDFCVDKTFPALKTISDTAAPYIAATAVLL